MENIAIFQRECPDLRASRKKGLLRGYISRLFGFLIPESLREIRYLAGLSYHNFSWPSKSGD
jgi:hypothetical protein